MNIDEFIQNRSLEKPRQLSLRHRTLPIEVWVSETKKLSNWYYQSNRYRFGHFIHIRIEELGGKRIEDVSEEYVNLLILKYSLI